MKLYHTFNLPTCVCVEVCVLFQVCHVIHLLQFLRFQYPHPRHLQFHHLASLKESNLKSSEEKSLQGLSLFELKKVFLSGFPLSIGIEWNRFKRNAYLTKAPPLPPPPFPQKKSSSGASGSAVGLPDSQVLIVFDMSRTGSTIGSNRYHG